MPSIPYASSSPKSSPKTALLVALIFLTSGISLAMGGIYYYAGPAHHNGHISLGISDARNTCIITASYNVRNTHKVQAYIQQRLKDYVSLSADNERINAHVIAGDKISFRVQSVPGDLKMVLYKNKSTSEAHVLWRQMAEDLKSIIIAP